MEVIIRLPCSIISSILCVIIVCYCYHGYLLNYDTNTVLSRDREVSGGPRPPQSSAALPTGRLAAWKPANRDILTARYVQSYMS